MALITKTYLTKSNTLVKDNLCNVGLNPILELNYGKMISRGIIYFDHEKVKKLVEGKTYPDINKLRHVLKMTNTSSYTDKNVHKPCFTNDYDGFKNRASSFDLIFFLINKEWDMGKGFDFVMDMYKGTHTAFSTDGSNWMYFRDYFKWDEDGVYSTDTLSKEMDKATMEEGNMSKIIIGFQHFDFGNENIEFDITCTFNKFITGELDNYGIGIAFAPSFEYLELEQSQYVGFFTQHTNSFFEPYVETTYNETIEDDRSNFYLDKDNKLYFYASVGGNYVNLDEMPTCNVNGTEIAPKQATKGVYYVDLKLSSQEHGENEMLYDVWSNIKYNGNSFPDVELPFVTKSQNGFFSFGIPKTENETNFIPSVYGIGDHEKIKQGDIRKVNVECRIPYTSNQLRSVDGIEYRIYVEQGKRQIDVIPWNKVERGYNENYFIVNTSEMLPARYFIDLRVHRNLELINHLHVLEFDVAEDVTDDWG